MKHIAFLLLLISLISCKKESFEKSYVTPRYVWESHNDSLDIAKTEQLGNSRMHLKLINAKGLDKNEIWDRLNVEINSISPERIKEIAPFILEQNIPTIQGHVINGDFTYEELTVFYLNRIARFESDNNLSLNAVISLNEAAVRQARALDQQDKSTIDIYSVHGMPILLKDNIGFKGLPTTAGAIALKENYTENAFVVERLEDANAIILGKANLSEWAYFLCSGCPVGYSAVGGQTINPYGRLQFESGGSSSGSGAAVAANYAVAAVGSETSGSILSPSSQNNIVGLKPTIGLLSRSGIVPISSHLDTAGPMTKSVIDNAILLGAMVGEDASDSYSFKGETMYSGVLYDDTGINMYFGVIKEYLNNSLYADAVAKLKAAGWAVKEVEKENTPLPGFLTILNKDMKIDLKSYYEQYVNKDISPRSIKELVVFNNEDSITRIPYGQQLFKGILTDSTTAEELAAIKKDLMERSNVHFDKMFSPISKAGNDPQELDVILSINNYDAGYAAVAHRPAIAIPMGFTEEGEPMAITLIGWSKQEQQLYEAAAIVEDILKARKLPAAYE